MFGVFCRFWLFGCLLLVQFWVQFGVQFGVPVYSTISLSLEGEESPPKWGPGKSPRGPSSRSVLPLCRSDGGGELWSSTKHQTPETIWMKVGENLSQPNVDEAFEIQSDGCVV